MKNILRDYQNDAHFSTGLVKQIKRTMFSQQIAKANWCDFSSKQWKKTIEWIKFVLSTHSNIMHQTQSFKFLEPSIAQTLVKQTSSII